jgi:hypothetical protein
LKINEKGIKVKKKKSGNEKEKMIELINKRKKGIEK